MGTGRVPATAAVRLSELISQRPRFTAGEALRIVAAVAEQIERLHSSGRIHRGVNAEAIQVDLELVPVLSAAPTNQSTDASNSTVEWLPLELRELHDFTISADIATAQESLRGRGLQLDPRQLDLFALGALLCRLVAGQPVDTYLRSSRVKGSISQDLQTIIERACGLDGRRQEFTAESFIQAVSEQLREEPARAASERPSGGVEAAAGEILPEFVADVWGQDTSPSILSGSLQPDTSVLDLKAAESHRAVVDDLPFQRLGHYEVLARIGHGGMGDVFRGYEPALDRTVALKVLPSELARHEDFVGRFRAEATAAARLIHPGIVQIFFIGEDHGQHFFAMQFVDGESLAGRLAQRSRLPVAETLEIVEQILSALSAAHEQGMIHRDIKPGNILLDRRTRRALLADFGLVKVLEGPGSMTATGIIMGTVDYISPEQGRGRDVDGRADLYSLGVVMYQLLSGRLPFEANSPTAMIFLHAYEAPPPLANVSGIPEPLAAVVHKLLEKSPLARYQTAGAVLADLRAFREGRPPRFGAALGAASSLIVPGPATEIVAAPRPTDWGSVALPALSALPASAEGFWTRLRQSCRDALSRHAPELLQQLQNTQQQVDGAVAEYERRVRDVGQLRHDADQLVAEFLIQLRDCEDAASAASARFAATSDPQALQQARAERQECDQAALDLRAQVVRQRSELEPIEQQFRQANAMLLKLRSQRDILQARLKIARARAHVHGGRRFGPLRRSKWAAVGATAALVLVLIVIKSLLTASSAATLTTPATEEPPLIVDLQAHLQPQIPLQQLLGHTKEVRAVAFSPTSLRLASGSQDGTIRIWDATTGAPLKVFENILGDRPDGISTLAFSPDGKLLATGSSSGSAQRGGETLKLWDPESGQQVRTITGSTEHIGGLSFHPTEPLLAASHGNPATQLKIWNLKSGRAVRILEADGNRSHVLVYSPDGSQLAAGESSGRISLWNVEAGTVVQTLDEHDSPVTALAFNREGRLASGDEKGLTLLWDVGEKKVVDRLPGLEQRPVALAFSPDGEMLAVASGAQTRVWDLTVGEIRGVLSGQFAKSVAYSSEGSRIATGSGAGSIKPFLLLWDGDLPPFTIGREARKLPLPGCIAISDCNERGEILATNGSLLSLFDLRHGGEPRTWKVGNSGLVAVSLSADGRRALIGESDGTLRDWDIVENRELRRHNLLSKAGNATPKSTDAFAIRLLGHLPNSHEAFVATSDKWILWNRETGAEIDRFDVKGGLAAALSPDGRFVARGSYDRERAMGDLRLLSVATGEEIRRFFGHVHYVWSLAFSHDGTRLLSGGRDTMHLWNVDTGEEIRRFKNTGGFTKRVAFAPDGRHAASSAGRITYWNLETGEELLRFAARGEAGLVFGPDGEQLLSIGPDIQVWDVDPNLRTRRP